jgi:hypothetical protein
MSTSDVCPSAMCSLLPFGYVLLAIDSFHDLRWCLAPSVNTERQLKGYYTAVLVPRLLPIPYPGFLFPIYVTYVFLSVCPDHIGWCLFFCYIPLCRRYYRIVFGHDDLEGWWIIVGIRVIMALLVYKGLDQRGCRMDDYKDNFSSFILKQKEEYFSSIIENFTSIEL